VVSIAGVGGHTYCALSPIVVILMLLVEHLSCSNLR